MRWYIWDVIVPLSAAILAAKTIQWLWPSWHGNFSDFALLALSVCVTLCGALLAAREIREPFFNLLKKSIYKASHCT